MLPLKQKTLTFPWYRRSALPLGPDPFTDHTERLIMSIQRYESPLGLPFSRMIRAGGFVFFSGQIPMDSKGQVVRGDIKAQTLAVMDRLRDSLKEAGLGRSEEHTSELQSLMRI